MDFAKILLVGAAMVSLGAALAHARNDADDARDALGALRVLGSAVSNSLGQSSSGGSCGGGGGGDIMNADLRDDPLSLNSSSARNLRDMSSVIFGMKPDYLAIRCDELKRAYSDDLALVQRLEGNDGVSMREIEPALLASTRTSLAQLKTDVQANRIPAGMRQRLTARYPFLAFYVDGAPIELIPGMAAFKADLLRQIDEGIGKVNHLGEELRSANNDASIPEPLKQTKVRCRPSCPSTMGCTANLAGFWVPLPE